MTEVPYGVRTLPALYESWSTNGMIANIGARMVEVGDGTLADETLATVAFTVAEEGETTATADLKVDYYRPGKVGRLICRGRVRHRTRRLAFCEATVEQESGEVIAEARAVIAYLRDRAPG